MTPNPKLTNKDRKQLASILNLMTEEELEEWLDDLKRRVARRRAERGCYRAESGGRCNDLPHFLQWCHPAERLARSPVELTSDAIELCL